MIRTEAFADAATLARRFAEAEPFPHLVLDDFFDVDFVDRVHDEARQTLANVNASNEITQKLKVACTEWGRFGPATHRLISYFNSGEFITPLSEITGIPGLFGDPQLDGGGIHQTSRGGFLKMHTDFNWSSSLRADRRINVLFYLNKGWTPDYGGELVLADLDQKTEARVAPIYNRLVVFNTNDSTLHGHPEPLTFPEDYPRASVAMYYYSSGLPVRERWRRKATTTRYVPRHENDISLGAGSLRSRLGYLVRRFLPL